MKTTKQHILDVLFWGFLIGVPLGIAVYLFLSFQGAQLGAQNYANKVEAHYNQIAQNERAGIKPTNQIRLGSVDFIDVDRDVLIPAYGYRVYQTTYDPQTAEDVTFNNVKVNYEGTSL